MSISSFFGFRTSGTSEELPEIFPLSVALDLFVKTDLITMYSKILTDCTERTQGIPEKVSPLMWDNFLQNESCEGLITLLATAMAQKSDLFIVYNAALGLLRRADNKEESQIKEDYKLNGKSDVGTFLSFKHYRRTDMVKLYSSMEYCVVSSLNKTMNLSKAIQIKMADMRSSVSLSDSSEAITQGQNIAKALSNGKDVMIDAKDVIETGTPDISPIEKSITFLDSKRSFYLGLPLSYINGEQTGGIGSTGEADTRAVERGLKQYYISILKPVVEDIFDIKTSFKSNDFRQISSALEALKVFELVDDSLLDQKNKQLIIQKLFDVEGS